MYKKRIEYNRNFGHWLAAGRETTYGPLNGKKYAYIYRNMYKYPETFAHIDAILARASVCTMYNRA